MKFNLILSTKHNSSSILLLKIFLIFIFLFNAITNAIASPFTSNDILDELAVFLCPVCLETIESRHAITRQNLEITPWVQASHKTSFTNIPIDLIRWAGESSAIRQSVFRHLESSSLKLQNQSLSQQSWNLAISGFFPIVKFRNCNTNQVNNLNFDANINNANNNNLDILFIEDGEITTFTSSNFCPPFTKIHIKDSRLDTNSMINFSNLLSRINSLTEITLFNVQDFNNNNNILSGAKGVAFFNGILSNINLVTLCLPQNNITDNEINIFHTQFINHPPHALTSLYLSNNNITNAANLVAVLQTLQNIRVINISGETNDLNLQEKNLIVSLFNIHPLLQKIILSPTSTANKNIILNPLTPAQRNRVNFL